MDTIATGSSTNGNDQVMRLDFFFFHPDGNQTSVPTVNQRITEVTWVKVHRSMIGEREGMKRAARHKEAATWKNPNDLAILLTGGYYARYEQAGIEGSTACVAISASTKAEFEHWYRRYILCSKCLIYVTLN